MRGFFVALTLTLGTFAAAQPADPTPEQVRLQRTWQAVSAERNGAAAPDLVGHRLILAGDQFRILRDGELLFGGTYAVTPTARPATIRFRQSQGPTLRGEWQGIYRFNNDRLEIIDNADDTSKPPPSEFRTAPGSGYVLVRFEPS